MKLLLSLLKRTKQRSDSLEDKVERIQQGDLTLQNELIEAYKPFIAKHVSEVCKRYITEYDDEFSIGLIAFNEAIEKFNKERGTSLLSLAEVMIKRRVIDYIRQQARHQSLALQFSTEDESDGELVQSQIEANRSIDEFVKKTDEELRRHEIVQFSRLLQEFELSFSDLVESSPKHADARKNAMQVAFEIANDSELTSWLLEKKRLPIKQLEDRVRISRKTIERNRKYIIAIALILLGDYLYLKDYIKGVLKT